MDDQTPTPKTSYKEEVEQITKIKAETIQRWYLRKDWLPFEAFHRAYRHRLYYRQLRGYFTEVLSVVDSDFDYDEFLNGELNI